MRQRGRASWPLLLAAALSVTVVAGCTVGPSQRPPVAVRGDGSVVVERPPDAASPSAPAKPPPLEKGDPARQPPFSACATDPLARLGRPVPTDRSLRVECAEVPAEGGTSGQRASIGLVRIGLADGVQRPSLLVLGENDGISGSTLAARLATEIPVALLQQVQLIGMDPRGSGERALDCVPGTARATLTDADPGGGAGQGRLDVLLEAAREAAQECYLDLDEALGSYATATTVADIEKVRELLGVGRLAAFGLGSGARTLAIWADRFAGSVGRVVFDAPPDPTLDQPAAAQARAAAAEAAFDAFARNCTAQPGCPLGADPRQSVRGLLARIATQPINGPDGRQLSAGALVRAVLSSLDEPGGWPALAGALAAADRGDPSGLLAALEPVLGDGGRFDLTMATECNDVKQRIAAPQVLKLVEEWRTAQPLFGPVLAQGLLRCTPWPVPSEQPTTGPASGAPPILVLGSAVDPRGALDGTRRAAGQLSNAQFVSWQGAGHGSYPRTACVTDVVQAYLVDGVVPPSSVLCPP